MQSDEVFSAEPEVYKRLIAAHLSNQGLQHLVDEAVAALGFPLLVIDPSYRYIASNLSTIPGDSKLAEVLTEEIAGETLNEQVIAYIRDRRIDASIARTKGPFADFNQILDCNTLTSAVMVNGVCIGHVMMVEGAGAITEKDIAAFTLFTQLVAQELQKSELWGPTSGELGSYFLLNLLNDRRPSDAVTKRRMKALNFHPKDLLFMVCLHAPDEGLSQHQVEHIAAQLKPVLHHSIYTRYHQHLVILLSRDLDEGISERTEKKLRDVAALNGLTVGVSNSFTDVTETRAAYSQARAAIRYGERMARYLGDEVMHFYSDVSVTHLLDLAGRHASLLEFCHPALLALSSYDERHGSELMDTLFCYLEVAGSTSKAARLLSLHKNTMLYRLGRIREIIEMDLSSGENLFLLQISFRILIAAGLFSPRLHFMRSDLIDPEAAGK